jgi:8-oxo-dGTP diphosphatase
MKKYCAYCKGRLKKTSQYYQCTKCGKRIFINSAPAAATTIIKDGKFLISKRANEPQKGYYDFVGGFLNKGEDPKRGAIRETKEETGLDVKIVKQVGIYIDKGYLYQGEKYYVMIVLYLVEIVGGKMKPQDDVASLHWFDLENPPKKLAFSWLKKALNDLREI